MTDGTRIGVSCGPMIPWRGTAMLYAIMLIMLTLAACGGDSPDAGGNGTSTAVPQGTAEAAGAMPKPGQNGAKAKGGFNSVSAGKEHSCGVRVDGSAACWGGNEYGQATPPEGQFASISAGSGHTCGVRADGFVACWGSDSRGQATPPEGAFTSVSAGGAYTCGVKTGGSIACWGSDSRGQATPPEGAFTSVSAGGAYTCGVKTGGSIACWGSDSRGQGHAARGTIRFRQRRIWTRLRAEDQRLRRLLGL